VLFVRNGSRAVVNKYRSQLGARRPHIGTRGLPKTLSNSKQRRRWYETCIVLKLEARHVFLTVFSHCRYYFIRIE